MYCCHTFNLIACISAFLIATLRIWPPCNVYQELGSDSHSLFIWLFNFLFGVILLGVYIYILLFRAQRLRKVPELMPQELLWECHYNLSHAFPFSIFDNFSAPGSLSAVIKKTLSYQGYLETERPGDNFPVRVYFNLSHEYKMFVLLGGK